MIYMAEVPQEEPGINWPVELFSEERWEKAMRYIKPEDRNASLISWLLLLYGLNREYGAKNVPRVHVSPRGKPFLKDRRDIHFNISHTKGIAAVAISDLPVGLDVQVHVRMFEDILETTMCREEIEKIREEPKCFTLFWTLKEAWCKWKGVGLGLDSTGEIEAGVAPDGDGRKREESYESLSQMDMSPCLQKRKGVIYGADYRWKEMEFGFIAKVKGLATQNSDL